MSIIRVTYSEVPRAGLTHQLRFEITKHRDWWANMGSADPEWDEIINRCEQYFNQNKLWHPERYRTYARWGAIRFRYAKDAMLIKLLMSS